jgi:hypothetical protein
MTTTEATDDISSLEAKLERHRQLVREYHKTEQGKEARARANREYYYKNSSKQNAQRAERRRRQRERERAEAAAAAAAVEAVM